MWGILFVTRDIYIDSAWGSHCNFVVLIRNGLILLLYWMWHLGYLAFSVTVVTSPLMQGRFLCGEGLWRQRCSSREEDGGTWELYHSDILAKSTFFPDNSDNFSQHYFWILRVPCTIEVVQVFTKIPVLFHWTNSVLCNHGVGSLITNTTLWKSN